MLIDEYFEKILASITSEEMKAVIHPDGTFSLPSKAPPVVKSKFLAIYVLLFKWLSHTEETKPNVVEICLDDVDEPANQEKTAGQPEKVVQNGTGHTDAESSSDEESEQEHLSSSEDEEDEDEDEDEDSVEHRRTGNGESAALLSFSGTGANSDPIVLD